MVEPVLSFCSEKETRYLPFVCDVITQPHEDKTSWGKKPALRHSSCFIIIIFLPTSVGPKRADARLVFHEESKLATKAFHDYIASRLGCEE